jgi:hypothetical protein
MRTPWPEALGVAELHGLPDRGQAEGLAGVHGQVEVLALDEVERAQVLRSAGSRPPVPAMSKPQTPSSRKAMASWAIDPRS